MVKGVDFGHPSSTPKVTSSAGGNAWVGALKTVASGGGVTGLFGSVLGNLGGIGGIVSGIASLFGKGEKAPPPPLVEFKLPEPQQQTVFLGTGQVVQNGNALQASAPVAQPSGTGSSRYQSAQIAQAVKLAILNSSSLNDVISEL
jgi:hypothetical protein